MDKEKTYKETPKQKKSASGIWTWILWILFASVAIVVVIHMFGNTIWYALKMMSTGAKTESTILGGMPASIDTGAIPEGTIHGGPIGKDDNKEIIW